MPGTILEVYVSPGDRVAYRQDLCTLEAMKMKNAIRAPREGVILEVRVQPNQTVAYGDILFVFAGGEECVSVRAHRQSSRAH